MADAGRVSALPTDRLVGGYLIGSALPVVVGRPEGWPVLLLVHAAGSALLLGGALDRARARVGTATPAGRVVRAAMEWYPLFLMPFLYWELPLLSGALWGDRFFDGVILGWEESVFGGQPSTALARRWPWPVLSEALHAAYLAYYPVIYALPLALYLRGRSNAFRATVFALMLSFTLHYVVFIAFPVQGPRYLYPAPGGRLADGPLYGLTHVVLEAGSSRGAAFPSAHAAIALVQTLSAARWLPRAVPVFALVTIGLSLGAVYGGFHYGIDIVVGLLAGLLVAVIAPRVRESLA